MIKLNLIFGRTFSSLCGYNSGNMNSINNEKKVFPTGAYTGAVYGSQMMTKILLSDKSDKNNNPSKMSDNNSDKVDSHNSISNNNDSYDYNNDIAMAAVMMVLLVIPIVTIDRTK